MNAYNPFDSFIPIRAELKSALSHGRLDSRKDGYLKIVGILGSEGDPPPYRDRPRFPYVTEVESYRDRVRRMRTWTWLCGLDEEVELRWEQSEPVSKLNHT